MIEREIKKEPNGGREEAETDARCPVPMSLFVSVSIM